MNNVNPSGIVASRHMDSSNRAELTRFSFTSSQVVDWAHCDYCNRWVHLNSECSRNAVIGDNAFMCALCRGFDGGPTPQVESGVPFEEEGRPLIDPSIDQQHSSPSPTSALSIAPAEGVGMDVPSTPDV